MKRNLQMIVFVLLLGLFTSFLIIGGTVLTEDRIEANEEALLKSAILDGFDRSYNFTNIHDVFDESVEIITYGDYTFYRDTTSGRLSYQFDGSGLWGPIRGVLTLESDLVTIAEITVLHHEETPGLGGVVAERDYLDNFIGKLMTIDIVKGATTLNDRQVDGIVGATRTSDLFETLLNEEYNTYLEVWETNQE